MSLAKALADYFAARPCQWIDGRILAGIGGAYAWRSRCSDLRKPRFGMTIENRQRKVGRVTISEYRYVPDFQLQSEVIETQEATR